MSDKPVYAVLTNCTYDGMCYDASDAQDRLAKSIDRIHFDEAWYGYARFNPMYRERYAMRGDPAKHPKDGPTVFATHSTHKLLAALSQTSYIHIRDGKGAIDHGRFNEAYCSQASTSPLYALIASNDVAAAMMDGPAGEVLTQEVIDEAVACRLAVARIQQEFKAKKEWFFAPWNAETIRDKKTGKRVPFHQVPAHRLAHDPECWVLHPGEDWHGFDGIPDGWCMLDPIKFGIVCPGMKKNGELDASGIPADVVSAYLEPQRHRPVAHHRSHGALPFLRGRHEGEVGHAHQRAPRFQEGLRSQRAAGRGRAAHRGGGRRALRGHGAQGSRPTRCGAHMRKSKQGEWQAKAYAQLPTPDDDAAPRVPAAHGRQGGEGAALEDGGAHGGGGRHPVSARHSHRDAGRERRRERRSVAHLSARLPGIRRALPRIRQGSGGDGGE